jgi:nitric-oxide synthase, bacterial
MMLSLSRRRAPAEAVSVAEAETFVRAYHAENGGEEARRLREVRASIARTGTYSHTAAELAWAARAAWRHSARCTGRYNWRTLRVRDLRAVSDPAQVAEETIVHLREATNGGRVRSYITVFAPDRPGRPGPRIMSGQAVRYAGYRQPTGKVTGDLGNVGLTDLAQGLGWRGDGGSFDVLPLIIRAAGRLHLFEVPRDAVLEVPIAHPDFPWFEGLELRWYAVPVVTDMYLEAGGVRYPCAPFNGWYQASTEIGVRNFGDEARYNMLPAVAAGMGLDMSSESTLWRDRAAVELAVAVTHSFRRAGVMATDHQTETRRFEKFAAAEAAAGRPWCADWGWIVPPIGGSTTPAFHRAYPNERLTPGFFRHAPQAETTLGCPMRPEATALPNIARAAG